MVFALRKQTALLIFFMQNTQLQNIKNRYAKLMCTDKLILYSLAGNNTVIKIYAEK